LICSKFTEAIAIHVFIWVTPAVIRSHPRAPVTGSNVCEGMKRYSFFGGGGYEKPVVIKAVENSTYFENVMKL
jgi:hypothetical protein